MFGEWRGTANFLHQIFRVIRFSLPLPLLVLGVGANYINPAKSFHDFAVFAPWFYACSDFHIILIS